MIASIGSLVVLASAELGSLLVASAIVIVAATALALAVAASAHLWGRGPAIAALALVVGLVVGFYVGAWVASGAVRP